MQQTEGVSRTRILVTGGCGFIGSSLLRFLLEQPTVEVLNLDALTYAGLLSNTQALDAHPRYRFVQGDVRDRTGLIEVVKGFDPDAIIHLAAETHVDRSIDAPGDCVQTNVTGTLHLLEAARACWEKLSPERRDRFRFLQVSTDEVFGSLPKEAPGFTERSAFRPRSPYAASKAAGDHLVGAWGHTYGLPVLICHSSNNYGPRQFPEKLVPLTILKVLRGEPIPVYGDGLQRRDWLFVRDHVDALGAVLSRGRPGECYLIGADQECSNLDWVRRICRCLETISAEEHPLVPKPPAGGFTSLIERVPDRPGHDQRYALNTTKIQDEVGWRPATSSEDGLRSTVRWYLDHPDWWRPLVRERYGLQRLGQGHL